MGDAKCPVELASAELRADRESMSAAVAKDWCALEHASAELKADRDIVLAAISGSGYALQYAASELKADCEFILAAAVQNDFSWEVLEFASARARSFVDTYCWDIDHGPLGCAQYSLAKERREDARIMGRLKDAAKKQKRVAKIERVRRMK